MIGGEKGTTMVPKWYDTCTSSLSKETRLIQRMDFLTPLPCLRSLCLSPHSLSSPSPSQQASHQCLPPQIVLLLATPPFIHSPRQCHTMEEPEQRMGILQTSQEYYIRQLSIYSAGRPSEHHQMLPQAEVCEM